MEGTPKNERPISPEEFFETKIQILPVSKEEFLEMMKIKFPEESDENILQWKGNNFDQDGETYILLRTDIFPEEYMPYLEIHEKWEAYIARREGYNLWDKSVREYKKGKEIERFDVTTEEEFAKDLNVYNYEFRHEYAVYKEYQEAARDGKLDEYYQWFMDLREKEKLTTNEQNLRLIENDTKIRNSIYKKLTEGTKHSFIRN